MYYSRHVSGILLRHFRNTNVNTNTPAKHTLLLGHRTNYSSKFRTCRRQISVWLRDQSIQVARACTKQFEFIVAQRVRRTVQIFHLYTRIWEETALREFMKAWRRRIARNTKSFIVGAVGVTTYQWDKERISDEEMYSYSQEIDAIHKLRDSTVICPKCCLRLVIDVTQPGVKYCECYGVKSTATHILNDEWKPFIERQDMLVWRKEEPHSGGLYAYKVYGSFADVTAEDFLQVQIDVEYRKEWDHTAKELTVIESDPVTYNAENGCSDIIYWEMVWPRLFANRDYVYQRRWIQDKQEGVIIIISKVTNHPQAPIRPDTHRVSSYWSFMVIKPYTDFHESGIEFGLTYFDDPGVNIPTAITSWVAMSGFPDYLCRMREATKEYKKYKMSKESSVITSKSMSDQDSSDIERHVFSSDKCEESSAKQETSVPDEQLFQSDSSEKKSSDDESFSEEIEEENQGKDDDTSEASTPDENQGFLSYFFLNRLFA